MTSDADTTRAPLDKPSLLVLDEDPKGAEGFFKDRF